MAMHLTKPTPALVEKIFTAPNAIALREVIGKNSVRKIIVHPAFEHKLLQNRNGDYKVYIESVTSLFQTKEDSKNTLVIYESKEDIAYARQVFAKYGAILEPDHWIIDPSGALRGEGSRDAIEIVRAMVKDSSSFVIGGLMLDYCVQNAILDIRRLLIEIGASDFPRTINKLIAKTKIELAYSFQGKG